ncbi:MAG: hypothetical protein ACJAZO_003370 [Myxococcota bacterium]|jgi:hypothetical protein
MNRYAALMALTAGLFVACETKDCDPETETCPDVDTGGCDNSIDEVFPENGEAQAFFRTSVEVKLDEDEAGATITLTGPDGDIAGTSSVDGDTITFVPGAALSPSTEYTVTVDYSCGTPTTTFSTSSVGSAITAADIEDNTYSLELRTGRFVEPQGIGSILGDFIDQEILIGVQSVGTADIQLIGAIGDGGSPPGQGECDPTIPFPEASFTDNPFFQVGPETTTLSIAGFTVTIADLEISGAFSPDGSLIAGATLAGVIDTRPLVPLLNADDNCEVDAPRCCDTDVDPGCDSANDVADCCDEDAICDLAGQIGVACQACEGGTGDFCLTLLVDSLQAEQVVGAFVDPQHAPADEATAPVDSTNICDIAACSGSSDCLAEEAR